MPTQEMDTPIYDQLARELATTDPGGRHVAADQTTPHPGPGDGDDPKVKTVTSDE